MNGGNHWNTHFLDSSLAFKLVSVRYRPASLSKPNTDMQPICLLCVTSILAYLHLSAHAELQHLCAYHARLANTNCPPPPPHPARGQERRREHKKTCCTPADAPAADPLRLMVFWDQLRSRSSSSGKRLLQGFQLNRDSRVSGCA